MSRQKTEITSYRQSRSSEFIERNPMETWRCDIYPPDDSDHHGVGRTESEAVMNAALAYRRWEVNSKERGAEAFLNVAQNIPATWTCLECKQEFDNGPYGEMPWAVRSRQVCSADGAWHNRVVGDVCKACTERPYAPKETGGE